MVAVDLVLPSIGTRRWHCRLAERLRLAGHDVAVTVDAASRGREIVLDGILRLEARALRARKGGLAEPVAAFEQAAERLPDLVVDLRSSGAASRGGAPVVTVLFQGERRLSAAAKVLGRGAVPVVDLLLDGEPADRAAPMASSRVFVSRGLEDVLARAITLIVRFCDRFADKSRPQTAEAGFGARPAAATELSLASTFLLSSLPRLGARAFDQLRYHGDHWRVGYRFLDGPGVAETGSLGGEPWQVLPDDGRRFYADPFPVEWQGQYFIFVEELVHATGKGVLSVSACDENGRFGVPQMVLEEPFHLSYPQVFHRDGAHWMIPETGAGRKLALYRAERFPDRWVEHETLIAGRQIYDATLLEHEGLLWLIGTERDGAGNASDTMVAFFAATLHGPWQAHPMNPILIDKAAARPGGGFARRGERIVLPVQDGTERYGGGLGLSEIRHLDTQRVELARPVPIGCEGYWPYPRIHTLNRSGRLETIDGLARVPKRAVR